MWVPARVVPAPAHLHHRRPWAASGGGAALTLNLLRVWGALPGRRGGPATPAETENPEPQRVLLNRIAASYLHSLSLQKCSFLAGLYFAYATQFQQLVVAVAAALGSLET